MVGMQETWGFYQELLLSQGVEIVTKDQRNGPLINTELQYAELMSDAHYSMLYQLMVPSRVWRMWMGTRAT